MRKKMREYLNLRAAFLRINPTCAVFPWLKSEDVHHMRGRIGRLLCDKRYWLAVSREGHEKIGREPDWARRMGYLCVKGQWGRVD